MKTWRWSSFATALALLSGAAEAATYAYRNDTFSYDTPSASATSVTWHTSGAAPACTNYPNGDDDWANIPFPAGATPFTFTFGGTAYSSVRVFSNGMLAFGNDTSGYHRNFTPEAMPITTTAPAYTGCPRGVPVNVMVPYWTDIVAGTANNTRNASIKYEMLGTAPNRRFVISWENVKLYGQTARYNFQVTLYESAAGVNGNFRYQYTSGSSNGSNATVGVQLSSTDYTQYSYNQQFIDTTNGTAILWYPANQLAAKAAEYRFDESTWLGTAGEIKDTSGNSRDASRAGAASSTAAGRLCRGADIPHNTANNVIDAVATPMVVGQTGSIDFWFYSNAVWNSADAMLFDATSTVARPFFLMKSASGALRFAVSDSAGAVLTATTGNQSFAANTWHHVGVTWNLRVGTNLSLIQVFLDGTLATSTRGTTNGTLPSLASLYIGDNRTSGVTPNNGTGNSANGVIDEFYVYTIDVSGPQFQADMNLTRPTCTALDHFHIIHNGTARCAGNITIEAHDLNHALFSLAGTSMTVSTSTGNGTWSGVKAINSVTNSGSGNATYTFADENRVVLSLDDPYAETLNINVNSGGITENSFVAATCSSADYTFGTVCDANLTFKKCDNSFECIATGLTYTNLTSTPTGRNPLYTKLAGTAFSFDVIALDSADNQKTTFASDADRSVTVELVDGTNASATCESLSPIASTTLTYKKADQPTEKGRKAVGFTVNKAAPNLLCRVTDANYVPSVVGCSSDSFALRPKVFDVSASITDYRAGRDFTITANSGVTFGYTGTPVVVAANLRDHNNAAAGTLTGSFAAGTGITSAGTFQYQDVGTLTFLANAVIDSTFAAVDATVSVDDCVADSTSNTADANGKFGCVVGSAANATAYGRFYPDHFTYNATLTPACSGFTYMGQPKLGVDLALSAMSLNGSVTTRYTSGYDRLGTFSITAPNGGDVARLNPALPAFVWTKGRYVASNASTTYTRAAAPDGSFETFALQANILTEPDGVQILISGTPPSYATSLASATTRIRDGRLRLSNVYGSVSPLKMPVEAQYWTGKSWVRNSDDNCTAIATGNVLLPAATTWTRTGPDTLTGGTGEISLTPSGAGSISVCADLGDDPTGGVACAATSAALPWLQSRWPPGSNYDNDPAATATFGVFSSESKRGVYNREMY